MSVRSQADTEGAGLDLERTGLRTDSAGEHRELAGIYKSRGLDPVLATQVVDQLMAHDALGSHARDELGISETLKARPVQAALAPAGSFAVGAAMPLLVTALVPYAALLVAVSATSLLCLVLLGGLAAAAGGEAGTPPGRCASSSGVRGQWRSRHMPGACSAPCCDLGSNEYPGVT